MSNSLQPHSPWNSPARILEWVVFAFSRGSSQPRDAIQVGISEADINKVGVEQVHKLNVRFLPCAQLKAEVEAVTLEFDGIYDIAGEVVVGDRGDGAPKSYKYYKKVYRGQTGQSGSSAGSGTSTFVTGSSTLVAGSSALRQAQGPKGGLVESDMEDEA